MYSFDKTNILNLRQLKELIRYSDENTLVIELNSKNISIRKLDPVKAKTTQEVRNITDSCGLGLSFTGMIFPIMPGGLPHLENCIGISGEALSSLSVDDLRIVLNKCLKSSKKRKLWIRVIDDVLVGALTEEPTDWGKQFDLLDVPSRQIDWQNVLGDLSDIRIAYKNGKVRRIQ